MLPLFFVLAVPDAPQATIAAVYATEVVKWNLTRAELIAHERLPEKDPLKDAIAAADPLRVVEARLMRALGRVRARVTGHKEEGASFKGSVLKKLEVIDRGAGLFDLTLYVHAVRDEHGLMQEKDFVCTSYARLKKGVVDELPYFVEPSACR